MEEFKLVRFVDGGDEEEVAILTSTQVEYTDTIPYEVEVIYRVSARNWVEWSDQSADLSVTIGKIADPAQCTTVVPDTATSLVPYSVTLTAKDAEDAVLNQSASLFFLVVSDS